MIKLLSLKFNNIGRFTEEQSIDFSNRDKLIQIDANNLNTGGSSGSGKTTIIDALMYLLDMPTKPATVLQSRYTTKPMYAIGEFDIDGKHCIITRDKKDGYTIVTSEETISGNAEQAEIKLNQLLGIPKKLLQKMIHKKQKDPYFFLNMTGTEIYKFLITVLGLERYFIKEEQIATDIKNKNLQFSQLELSVNATLLPGIKEIEDLIASKNAEPVCTITKEYIDQLNAQKAGLESNNQVLKNNKTIELSALIEPRKQVIVFDTTKLLDLHQQKANLLSNKTSEVAQLIQPVKQIVTFDATNLINLRKQLDGVFLQKNGYIKQINDTKNQLKDELRNTQIELSSIATAISKARELGTTIQRLQAEKAEIEKAICPTCNQTWVGEQANKKIQSIATEIQNSITTALSLKEKISNRGNLETRVNQINLELAKEDNTEEITKFNQQIADLTAQIVTEQSKEATVAQEAENNYLQQKNTYLWNVKEIDDKYIPLISTIDSEIVGEQNKQANIDREAENIYLQEKNVYLTKTREINEKYNLIFDSLNKQINETNTNLNAARSTLVNHEQNLKIYREEKSRLDSLLNLKKNNLKETELKLDGLKKLILVAEESKRLIKTYTLQIFQDTLDEIGETATQILNGIPNVATGTVYFESCKENKDGSIRDEVTCILNIDGEENIPVKSLSGGEDSAIGLAIDLATVDVIETKSGNGADFYLLDEPYDGLDAVCRKNCLEILKKIETNKHIIVIDHSEELKSLVSDIITVVRDGKNSYIQ